MLDTLNAGKKELSLGYDARLIPSDKYDFEQRDIVPHHLAVVEAGRCGPESLQPRDHGYDRRTEGRD